MEILPLSFGEMDRVQQSARAAFANCGLGRSLQQRAAAGGNNNKRTHGDIGNSIMLGCPQMLPTTIPSHAGAQPRRTVQCYDPAQPRTGRWTDEEISFRDTLISHFLSGSLPLSNGLKLNDFLPVMLKSKQSRLAKKMKHAKLSTKYFYPQRGCAGSVDDAGELSRLERDFVASIPDPVERSEVKFHMGREWREHFANRCASLSVVFDGRSWLASVEDMERRLAFEKERHRLVKRRFMMGKAMEKDASKLERGVFVNESDGKEELFELVVEKSVSNSVGRNRTVNHDGSSSNPSSSVSYSPPPVLGGRVGAGDAPPSVWTSNEPNFKHAAPFLAGIASYIERNGVPFEHVDVWVPSFVEDGSSTQGSGSSLPGVTSEPSPEKSNFRLCFGGSVTMGVQIAHDPNEAGGDANSPSGAASSSRSPSPSAPSAASNFIATMRRHPLSSDDKTNFSLFGDYSHKFSFSSGCGLPGRIFKSGVPAWEQFVSRAHPAMFERRGGAMQFGIKTAVGVPIESPNVGRVVLVMYSKYDRPKDEQLVGRMLADLKLLNPCPRWKLVVDVDTPSGIIGRKNVSASSLQAPPPEVTAPPPQQQPRGSPTLGPNRSFSRANSNASSVHTISTAVTAVDPAAANKERQIKSLLVLLASNIPSNMNSPLGQQLQGIMSLRLILLKGNKRTPEEEQLMDTLLVLYESYIHAGRSQKDIAVMVARDFTFHLGHLGGLAAAYGCLAPAPQGGPPHACAPAPQGAPHQMYRAPAMGQAPFQSPMMGAMANNMGNNPLMGPLPPSYNHHRAVPQQVHNPRSPPTMMPAGMMMNQHPNMNYHHSAPQQQLQRQPRSASISFLPRQHSAGSFVAGSPRSTASR